MATTFTNRKASQALRGEAVLVTLNSADAANLDLLTKGMIATNSSSGKTGTVGNIDSFGYSFQVIPIQPDRDFSSTTPYGYLAVSETVSVAT